VQQIAAATSEQARGSELIIKSAEKMRVITQHVERSSQEQARGGKQVTQAIESISAMVNQINLAQRERAAEADQLAATALRAKQLTRDFDRQIRTLGSASERLHNLGSG
jgi:methyl-accepting chemotaxis protein